METTFYHDEGMAARKRDSTVEKLKSKMTLDFNGPPMKKQLLQSPDLNLLKLASPELEKLIIQHNGMVTTPTPTQILFPRSVTEEQEAYARGFVDALAQLHKKEGDEGNSTDGESEASMPPSSNNLVTLQNVVPVSSGFAFSTLAPLPDSLATTSQPSRNSTPFSQSKINVPSSLASQGVASASRDHHEVPRNQSPFVPAVGLQNQLVRLKEEPQTVPTMSNTPPISPIDMYDQEKQKVERKRARNRVAARKCRYRKLERISRLEDRVSDLKNQNTQLSSDAHNLKEQVWKLKQQILDHVNSGCNIMVSGDL